QAGAAVWLAASEDAIRQHLLRALADDRAFVEAVLTSRQLEALDFGYRERVVDVELPWIRDLPFTLPGLFADAARRAREAGFGGIELHYGRAYTMGSFLSRLNTRTAGDGGGPAD